MNGIAPVCIMEVRDTAMVWSIVMMDMDHIAAMTVVSGVVATSVVSGPRVMSPVAA